MRLGAVHCVGNHHHTVISPSELVRAIHGVNAKLDREIGKRDKRIAMMEQELFMLRRSVAQLLTRLDASPTVAGAPRGHAAPIAFNRQEESP